MKIVKSQFELTQTTRPTTLGQIPLGTLFKCGDNAQYAYLRVQGGYVNPETGYFHNAPDSCGITSVILLPNAVIVIGE